MDLLQMTMEKKLKKNAPLADRMRPTSLNHYVGQLHLVGDNASIARMIRSDRLQSMIFYGPPGTGKTTLAEIIAQSTSMFFDKLSAVTAGIKELREVTKSAEDRLAMEGQRSLLFIDEIHRFNKAQQDALLPFVERGVITLVGATTENPYFEVNKALISRCLVVELKSLSDDDIEVILRRALSDDKRGLGIYDVRIDDDAMDYLVRASGGDARNALNALEIAVLSTKPEVDGSLIIDVDAMLNSIQKKAALYDKDGDSHYDVISAFIKSMRGTDPDAATHYLARMIYAGEDPKFIARRMVIFASEDVGNADPQALTVALNAFRAVEVIGLPEAQIVLSQAVNYLACAPKSNRSYMAIASAMEDVKRERIGAIPPHLQDAHYPGAKNLNRGVGYLYPHSYAEGYVKQQYLPDNITHKSYYRPKEIGDEKRLYDRLVAIDYFRDKSAEE